MEQLIRKLTAYFGTWSLGVLDEARGRWAVPAEPRLLPYLRAQNAGGRHILLKPSDEREPFYLLADDLTWADLEKDHQTKGVFKQGRLVVETSPHNYQVWIHSRRPLDMHEKKYWLGRLHSDPACGPEHRWGRCPGFRNRKEKYADERRYPLAKLVWIDWRTMADIPPMHPPSSSGRKAPDHDCSFPSPSVWGCAISLSRRDYERGDQSATDFAYILAMLRRGLSEQEIRFRLIEERRDWRHHASEKQKEAYFRRTYQRACLILQASPQSHTKELRMQMRKGH
jgi:hypothetical protein